MQFESFLRQPFSQDETLEIARLEDEIHQEQKRLMALASEVVGEGIQKMSALRLKASSTLLRGDYTSWLEANAFIQSKTQDQQSPTWVDVCKLNSFFIYSKGPVVRTQEIYTGHLQACPQAELEIVLLSFQQNILNSHKDYSVLVHAALCQYWLVSIHPFLDGNGRTSILLSDWLLTMNGYLPQSFTSKLDAIVMYIPGRVKKMTPGLSVIRILQNVLQSYKCF